MTTQPRRPAGTPVGGRVDLATDGGAAADLMQSGDPAAAGGWPAIDYEQHGWAPGEDLLAHLDVFERMRIQRPYKAAVLQPIADITPHLDSETASAMEEGASAIQRFDEQMAILPVPMPAVMLRTESATSSQIEHLTASARNLAMATIGVSDKRNAMLVAANVRAMQTALDMDGEIDETLVLEIHHALLSEAEPDIVGRFRDRQVWIGGESYSPHRANFVPPHPDRVETAMADLVQFARRTDMPALAQAAIFHAQFETVHPFEDGNGRTGRVLIQSVLRERGFVRHVTVPVSAGLLIDADGYFRALTAYRQGDVNPIVTRVSLAAVDATRNGRQLAEDVMTIREDWMDRIKARRDSAAWALADALFSQPVVNGEYVAQTIGVSDRTARNVIDTLVAADVLTETTAARRNRLWQASDVTMAMDAFAARSGRRIRG